MIALFLGVDRFFSIPKRKENTELPSFPFLKKEMMFQNPREVHPYNCRRVREQEGNANSKFGRCGCQMAYNENTQPCVDQDLPALCEWGARKENLDTIS